VRFYNLNYIRIPRCFIDSATWHIVRKSEHYLNNSTRFQKELLFETPEFSRKSACRHMREKPHGQPHTEKTLGKTVGTMLSALSHQRSPRIMLALGFRFTKSGPVSTRPPIQVFPQAECLAKGILKV
jgi:hypothetical protein